MQFCFKQLLNELDGYRVMLLIKPTTSNCVYMETDNKDKKYSTFYYELDGKYYAFYWDAKAGFDPGFVSEVEKVEHK